MENEKCLTFSPGNPAYGLLALFVRGHFNEWVSGWASEWVTFLSDLDGAGWPDLLPVPVPLPRHVLHRELADKHGVLVLLDVHVLKGLHDQQLTLCRHSLTSVGPQRHHRASFFWKAKLAAASIAAVSVDADGFTVSAASSPKRTLFISLKVMGHTVYNV